MKRMTLISLALASTLAAGLALAQPGPGHHADPEAQLQHLSVILELSPPQQAQLREILDARRGDMEAHRAAGREARAARREARRADREALEQQIASILDDTQKAKFEALKAERHAQRERRQGMRAGRHGEG